ncbi:hypothetical protein [Niabella aquatica]
MAANESLSVKKIPFYLFLILLGFLLFYVFDMVRSKNSGNAPTLPTKAGPIPEKLAKEYLNNYIASQDSLGEAYKLITEKGETLRGFWLSKKTLESIDSVIKKSDKDANIVGYSIYFGKVNSYSQDKRQALNLVVRGTVPAKKEETNSVQKVDNIAGRPLSDIKDEGGYFDTVDPCPTRCGEESPI